MVIAYLGGFCIVSDITYGRFLSHHDFGISSLLHDAPLLASIYITGVSLDWHNNDRLFSTSPW